MGMIGLGLNDPIYASRAISGNGQYMPDSTTILNHNGGATSDAWGTERLAQLNGTSDGFNISPLQDIEITFVGNTGSGNVEEWDPVAGAWQNRVTITDALTHVIRAPLGSFRIGCATQTGTSSVKMRTTHQSGTP